MIIQHLLALFLIVVAPVWDHFATKLLKSSKESRVKIAYYRMIVIIGWITTVIALVTVGWRAILTFDAGATSPWWLRQRGGARTFVAGVLIGLLLMIALSALQARRGAAIRGKMEKAFLRLSFILPLTGEERTWWIFVSLTAGICEEILYRGFLIHYFLAAAFPIGLLLAVIFSSVIFGAAHLYQGVAGVISTTILGLIFSAIFLNQGVQNHGHHQRAGRSANLANSSAQATARHRSIIWAGSLLYFQRGRQPYPRNPSGGPVAM